MLSACALFAQAQDVGARLSAFWENNAVPATSFAGVSIVDPESGQVLFERNARLLFTPASNTKIYSSALALARLGPDFRAETTVRAEGPLDVESGRLRGNLVLAGGGDPSLSARRFPYTKDNADVRDYALPEFEALADRVLSAGIRAIDGDVVGDDTAFLWEPLREGWAQDDSLYEYGAPVSALTVCDNAVEVEIVPGAAAGDPTTVNFRPAMDYFDVLNEVRTGAPGSLRRVEWDRVNGKRQLLLRGALPARAGAWRSTVALDDPALFAARYFRQALQRRGVAVRGVARARHRLPMEADESTLVVDGAAAKPIASHTGPPMRDVVAMVNKESHNLLAEILLSQVARVKNGVGSREGGLKELQRFLRESGVPLEGVALADASGLARLNLVSPEATARLLTAMWKSEHRDVWVESLPVGGVDGTLSRRFANEPLGARVAAKTGTLRGVSALSGYVTTKSGKVLVFSAMVNNYRGSSRPVRDFLDQLAVEIAKAD